MCLCASLSFYISILTSLSIRLFLSLVSRLLSVSASKAPPWFRLSPSTLFVLSRLQLAVLSHHKRGHSEYLRVRKLKVDEGEKEEGYVPAVIVDRHSVMDPVTLGQIVTLCRSIVHAAAGVVRIMTAFNWQPELPYGMAKTLSGAFLLVTEGKIMLCSDLALR